MGFLDEHCLFHELTDEKITASKPFYCGNNDLDDFFHENVTKFSYNLMGKSYCFALEDDPSIIVCAFTVSNDSIRVYDLPRSRRDYMKHMTHKHMRRYPGVLVGRLAVDCYFRQYLCYKENMHLFVFANLYAYRTTKYEINTTNAFADNPKNHVINPLNGNNKDYKMLLVNLSERSICSFH